MVSLHADLATYKLSEFKINDKEATLSASTRMIVTDDTKVYIDARKYRDYTVKVTVDDPANVITSLPLWYTIALAMKPCWNVKGLSMSPNSTAL